MANITTQLTAIIAEVCITVLAAIALSSGFDGAIFAACIAALAGLGGYQLRTTTKNGAAPLAKKPPADPQPRTPT